MQRLNAREAMALQVKKKVEKTSKAAHVHKEMNLLAVGDALLIDNADWPLKTKPNTTSWPRSVTSMGRKYTTRTLADDSGYVITRTA